MGKATREAKNNFKVNLESRLSVLNYGLECTDTQCKMEEHKRHLEDFTLSTFEALELSGKESLPRSHSGKKRSTGKLGWNDYVKPYSDESKFWYGLWSSAGKPNTGELYAIMKTKKMQYKYAVRRLKRCTDILTNDKFVESLVNENKCIFSEIRKLRSKGRGFSSRIDDYVGQKPIANHFADIYSRLFNNVNGDSDLDSLEQSIQKNISSTSSNVIRKIDSSLVKKAVNNMKTNKQDSIFDALSDMHINSPYVF